MLQIMKEKGDEKKKKKNRTTLVVKLKSLHTFFSLSLTNSSSLLFQFQQIF